MRLKAAGQEFNEQHRTMHSIPSREWHSETMPQIQMKGIPPKPNTLRTLPKSLAYLL